MDVGSREQLSKFETERNVALHHLRGDRYDDADVFFWPVTLQSDIRMKVLALLN